MNKPRIQIAVLALVSCVLLPALVSAQEMEQPYNMPVLSPGQPAPVYTQQQLDQMLAPIALYPDPLIGQILMAATYPLEVVEAYRWLQDSYNASLHGESLAAALEPLPWAPSVKSLVVFPQIVKVMNDNLQWTEGLGDAFLAQQAAVMDSVQRLRLRAHRAGTLVSTPQQIVSLQGDDVLIEPVNPEVVYVPYYDPAMAYGAWPYPYYPPYYFPGVAYEGIGPRFGEGIIVIELFRRWHRWDWRHHRIDIDDDRFRELNRGRSPAAAGVWEHDVDHRRNVPYRDAPTRTRFLGTVDETPREEHRAFRSHDAVPQISRAPGSATQNPSVNTAAPVVTPQNQNISPEHRHGDHHNESMTRQNTTAPVVAPQNQTHPATQQRASSSDPESFMRQHEWGKNPVNVSPHRPASTSGGNVSNGAARNGNDSGDNHR